MKRATFGHPMRVLHLAGEFPPLRIGGIATVLESLTRHAPPGTECAVLLVQGQDYQDDPSAETGVRVEAVDLAPLVRELGHTAVADHARIVRHLSDSALARERWDLLHVHDWFGVLPALAITARRPTPVVMTAHLPLRAGFTYANHPMPLQDKARLEALGFRIADRVTAPSRYVARLLQREYDVPAARISVVPNGVDAERFHPSRGRRTERPSMAAVCRLTEQKGLEHLLDVTERVRDRVPDVLLRVAGAGGGRDRLARGIAERGLADTVSLVGYVPHHTLPELYASSWVFVSTSVYEPFGLTTLEAMASGAAVVASPLGGAPDFVHEGESGLLRLPQDTESFASAVASLLGDDALRGRLCAGAQRRARELSWQSVAARFSQEYARAIGAAP